MPMLLAAAAPILVVLLLLAVRIPSLWAGATGLVVAVLAAALAFPLDAAGMAASARDMAPTVVEVAVILLGGVGLAEAMRRGGAQDRIADWLDGAERGADRTVTLLLLVFGLTPFMESVTGFGLGVVITAPLLVRLGLPPVKAVVSGLLGLVLVPWGSLGPGTLVAAQLGGVGSGELGLWSALLTLPVLVVAASAVLALNVGRPAPRQLLLAAAVVLVEWVALIAVNLVLFPPAGALASAVVVAGLLALTRAANGPLPAVDRALALALLPYFVLVGGIFAATGVLALLGASGPAAVLANPAVWLLIATAVAVAALDLPAADRWRVIGSAVRRWVPIAGGAVLFMVLGIVMAATGMAEHLAASATRAGYGFVAAIPAIGAFGGYLTGSNTGAAAMFSAATATASAGLGATPLIALAGQNVAGSFAIIASPPRIALAAAVALPPGERLPGSAQRVLAGAAATSAVLLGALTLLLA
ncbi:L-lactate permease [Saccharopolyspora sp. 6M]|uniref:L-lactate permease n=1 Tax=Saccharopolyspora sp. 6M TaxID=2877237 RepID=UPI001CD21CBB|nr:L-lactate permease [Saccharopolyspora sp. 6M]MCA1225457.1 L-lactate permease [Saccharopolyspora sp. 6M]